MDASGLESEAGRFRGSSKDYFRVHWRPFAVDLNSYKSAYVFCPSFPDPAGNLIPLSTAFF